MHGDFLLVLWRVLVLWLWNLVLWGECWPDSIAGGELLLLLELGLEQCFFKRDVWVRVLEVGRECVFERLWRGALGVVYDGLSKGGGVI